MKCTFAEEPQRELTEPEAIRRARNGDATAFEYLYRSHSRRVYGVCLRILRNTSDAEDVTQQIFLRVFRKIGTFRGDSAFSTWLHRVTVNAVLMHMRRKERTETSTDDPEYASQRDKVPREIGSSETSMLGAFDRRNLLRAIRELPCGHKRVFLLHDVLGYRHSEIVDLVGCSIACSKSRVHRARKRMRHLLHHPPPKHVNERSLLA
ncbi:MAG: RNA polymerase sigma factor [Candidatus Acidiferrales bacterium]